MKPIWYVHSNQVVTGPHSTQKVEEGLQSGKWSPLCMIWWKGQREWITLEAWKTKFNEIMDQIKPTFQKTIWYIEYLGQQKGPMNSNELISFVQSNGVLNSCRIWTTGLNRWVSVFEIPELVESFNISRRKYPRAPIKGAVTIKKGDLVVNTETHTISEGGLGFKANRSLNKNDEINLEIKSPMLADILHSTGQIVYSFENGVGGIEFNKLEPQIKSAIVSYVKQFKTLV